MFNIGRKRVGIGLASGLVIASAVGITSMTSAQGGADEGPAAPTITIELENRLGTVTYRPVEGEPVTQSIKAIEPCNVQTEGPELLIFTPTGPDNATTQLPSGGLGVGLPTSCGENAGFISTGQTLTVGLGSYFLDEDGDFANSILMAELQILSKRNASLTTTPGEPTIVSTSSDTFTATVVGDFTSITLAPTGGNGPPQQRGVSLTGAVFTLEAPSEFDAAVFCGDTYSAPEPGDAATSAEFERLPNEKKPDDANEPCEDIGVTVEIRSDGVFWDNSEFALTGTPQNVQALVTIEWAPVAPSVANTTKLEINYEGTDVEEDFVPAVWCESYEVVNGEVTATLPSGVPWCLVSSTSVLDGNQVFRTTVFYGAGDPVGRWS